MLEHTLKARHGASQSRELRYARDVPTILQGGSTPLTIAGASMFFTIHSAWLLPLVMDMETTLEDVAMRTLEATIATAPPSLADRVNSRVVLRDGSGATLRVTQPADHDALRRFFHELSPEIVPASVLQPVRSYRVAD